MDNVHVVLSARTFEFNHDTRLKSVQADQVMLELPALSSVLEILEAQGVDAKEWPDEAQEELRTPQSLAIYLRLAEQGRTEPFATYQTMLEHLWRERVLSGPGSEEKAKLVSDIAGAMADEESLWLSSARFDANRDTLEALKAADILIESERRVGFAHQRLFDFALARSFARETGRLSSYVLDRQESLFVRPKLWSGLTYLRGAEPQSYIQEVERIWSEPGLRRHLKFLLIDFLGSQRDPDDRETLLMSQALKDPDERVRAFRALAGSAGWFERVGQSFVRDAMIESESSANLMIAVLSEAVDFAPREVEKLIREFWLGDPANAHRIWAVLNASSHWTADTLKIAEAVIADDGIDAMRTDWLVAHLGAQEPVLALRLARAGLDRALKTAVDEAQERTKLPPPNLAEDGAASVWTSLKHRPSEPIREMIEGREWETLPTLAEEAPSAFIEILWPWFEQALRQLDRFIDKPDRMTVYRLPFEFDYRFTAEHGADLAPPGIPSSFRIALEKIAKEDPQTILAWIDANEPSELMPVHRLIAHLMAVHPEYFARRSAAYLAGDPRRLMLGSISDSLSTTVRLVAAASPHWTDEELEAFEEKARAYDMPPLGDKRDARARNSRRSSVRRTRLQLLRALPHHRMSAAARRRVQEEERVFGPHQPRIALEAGTIESILDAEGMAKSKDDAIVHAFEVLPDATGWDHPRKFMAGGNIQLSREFATFAADHPRRAVAIIKRLDKDNGTRAAGYAIEAMGEKAPADLVAGLIRDAVDRGFDGHEFRTSVARGVAKLAGRETKVSPEVLDLLERWLSEPAVPEAEAYDDLDTADDGKAEPDEDNPESLIWGGGGFSILPGGDYPLLEALIRARLEREESDRLIDVLSEHVERSRLPDSWEHLLQFFYFLRPERPGARADLLRKLFEKFPVLAGSRGATHLFARLHWNEPDFVDSALDRFRDNASPRGRMAYGEIVGLVAILQPKLQWASSRLQALLGDKGQVQARVGLATSAVNLWSDRKLRSRTNIMLLRLLEDPSPPLWTAIFDLFRIVDSLTPDDETVALLEAIAERLSGQPVEPMFIVERLASLLPHQARLVGELSEKLIAGWGQDLNDVRTRTAMAAGDLVDLAITLHRLGPDTREIGTNLLERLLVMELHEALQTLAEIDNRFRKSQGPRRRLRRSRPLSRRTRAGRPG